MRSSEFGGRDVDDIGELSVHDHAFAAANTTIPVMAGLEVGSDGHRQRREVIPALGYLSQVELPVTFGIGDNAAPVTVRLVWPDRLVQDHGPVEVDRVVEVHRTTE